MKKWSPVLCIILYLSGCSESACLSGCSDPSETDTSNSYFETRQRGRPSAVVEIDAPPTQRELEAPTRVVVLGTGTPILDPYRSGPSIAVIYRGESYIFDIGAGSMRRAIEARAKYDIPSLNPNSIRAVFITHLHSDHIADLPVLNAALWWERSAKLRLFGPFGVDKLSSGIEEFFEADIALRVNGIQPVREPDFYQIDTTIVYPGVVYEDGGLSVEAFAVPHGTIKPAYGYRIVTPDKTIVISGDTSISEIVEEKAKGADILFHEAVSVKGYSQLPENWRNYHSSAHTLSTDIAKLASAARPKKLIIYHGLFFGAPEESIVEEIRASGYSGFVELADDLNIY